MTREESIKYLKSADTTVGKKIKTRTAEALEMGIKALEQEPCEDAISREAVISVIYDRKSDFKNDFTQGFFADKIRDLPSVTPQPKMGRWIDEGFYAEGHSEHAYRCSECDEHYIGYVGKFKHCPNCGAKMQEEKTDVQ